MRNLLLNLALTAVLYMFYPVITVCTKKGKEFYTQPELRNTAIINAVIVKIAIIVLTYPTVGSFAPPVFWGYISYKMMLKHLLKTELTEPEQPIQEKQQTEPIPATPEKVKVKPVKVTKPKPAELISAQPEPSPTPTLSPLPETAEPQKQDNFKSFCIIAAFFAVFFFVIYISIGNQNNSDQEDNLYQFSNRVHIRGTNNFTTDIRTYGYSNEELKEILSFDITIYYTYDSYLWHVFENCPVLNNTGEEIYSVEWIKLRPYLPDSEKSCAECRNALEQLANS